MSTASPVGTLPVGTPVEICEDGAWLPAVVTGHFVREGYFALCRDGLTRHFYRNYADEGRCWRREGTLPEAAPAPARMGRTPNDAAPAAPAGPAPRGDPTLQ